MTRSPTHIAALEYAARGWHVFPCTPGGKEPLKGSRGHLDATIDPKQIDAHWSANPNYNVGIAVGPSNLVVLDVDVGTKKDGTQKRGRESLAEIESELTATLLATTGRGGTHAVYERPSGLAPTRIIGFKDGLDLIGDGYIVAAPSFLSETNRYYQWSQLHAIAPLPSYLQKVVREPRVHEKVQLTGTPIPEGSRNNALFKLGCALRDTGIGAEALSRALDAENKQRISPPLPDSELALIVNSVLQRVQVTRDVAAGAIVEQEIQQIFAPPRRSELLVNVARTPQPPMRFYSTGFAALDKLMSGGFATRHFCGVIGPPSAGKSALIGHWLVMLSKQRPILHVSTELPRWELFVRYAAHEIGFPWVDGVKGIVPQASMVDAVEGINIRVLGCDELDRNDPLGSIEDEVRAMTAEHGVAPIVAIDYIQNMATGAASETRFKVGELAQRARVISQVYDTAVIGVFSTQRMSYGGKTATALREADDPTAYLGAAKESGDIEFHCATLMYLDVDKLHAGDPKPARIAVARCRVGDVGFVGIRAKLATGTFTEDPTALAEMSAEARKARDEAQSVEEDCRRVLEAIRKLGGQAWGSIQRHSGLAGKRADIARDKLIEDGLVRRDDDVRKNGTKVPRAFTFWVVENPVSPPGVLSEEAVT